MIKQALQANFFYLALFLLLTIVFSTIGLDTIAFCCFIAIWLVGLKMIAEWIYSVVKNKNR